MNKELMIKIIKKHEYPGYIKFIKAWIRDSEDIQYIENDINFCINYCKKCKEGKNREIKELAEKGITDKDYDATIKWYETVARKALNDKAKEIIELARDKGDIL